jgi:tRNA A-37 threonylcarbamoyl transferase component Bud32
MTSEDRSGDPVEPGPETTGPTEYPEERSGTQHDGTAVIEPQERVERSASGHRYLLGRTLGEGGMAVVHEATDVQLSRPVAVKRMRSELAHRDEARQRFFTEAEILAGLDHPGTTPVFEAGRLPDGECFYAMKIVRGKTLAELLAERGEDELYDRAVRTQLLEIFSRVCQTVASAHRQGVIHRDLKPDNIMVDDLGAVYVMDWGLAKALDEDGEENQADSSRTRVGAVMGTPAYMSPEQASGRSASADRQTDVFSLGVMLYEILTGVNPFRGETAVESMKGVMYHDPESPRARTRRVNRTLSAITMKAIAKDPFHRYRSAVELAEDIQSYREFRPVSAIAPTAKENISNWSHRHPRMAAAAATLAIIIGLAAVVAVYQASVEAALMARAHDFIDATEERLSTLEAEIAMLEDVLGETPEGPERVRREHELADLVAQFEVREAERRSYALAVTGFTILSPDERAIAILRHSTLEEIRTAVEAGDLFGARARIQSAMRMYDAGNLFDFEEADYALLQNELEKVEDSIAAASVEAQPEAAANGPATRP